MTKSFKDDLRGQRFGRLTVLEFVPNDKPKTCWKCQCDCGNTIIAQLSNLKNGHTKSCGCLNKETTKEMFTKHSLRNTRLYGIWNQMKNRCYNKNTRSYKNYGGRGITVCDEWRNDFKAFYDWAMTNGYTDELSIDRIDVNGNYEPNNCRWVDMKTQCRNKRNNAVVEYQGRKVSLIESSELSGIKYKILESRYERGDREDRLFRSPRKQK